MNWEFIRIVELAQDVSGKWRAKVAINSEIEEECIFLKFTNEPSEAQIMEEVTKFLDNKNAE